MICGVTAVVVLGRRYAVCGEIGAVWLYAARGVNWDRLVGIVSAGGGVELRA